MSIMEPHSRPGHSGLQIDHEHLIVKRKSGKPYAQVFRAWDRPRKTAGVTHLRLQELRHQHASYLVNSGRALYLVRQIQGHANPGVVQRCAHLLTRSLQDVAVSNVG